MGYDHVISKSKTNWIFIRTHKNRICLDIDSIIYCQAEGSYTRLISNSSHPNVILSKSLKVIQILIQNNLFIRCHNSYVVNIKKVISFSSKKRHLLIDSQSIPISRKYFDKVVNVLLVNGIQDIYR